MRIKQVIALALAIVMMATVFIPAVSAADDENEKGIDLTATVLEPKPEIAITVDTDSIDFGELLPGDTSSSHDVMATNVGLKPIDVTMDVNDDGNGVFEQGVEINGNAWNDYSAQLISDDSDSFGVALHVPDDTAAREAISGVMTVFAQAIETPVAEFSTNVTSGIAPLDVQFTDLSANGPTSWAWDFNNDGTVDSTVQNPVYTYSAAGTYDVKLTVSNFAGSDDEVKTAYIVVNEPVIVPAADFSASPLSGDVPLSVQFTDLSANGPTAWSWSFGDDTTSEEQSPSHEYSVAGVYTVSLTVTNSAGSDTATKEAFITANAIVLAPSAAFAADVTWGVDSLTVHFTDQSTNEPTSWLWEFGDGATSTEQSPAHTYSSAGTYTVSLTVTNAAGTDSEVKTGYIQIVEPSPVSDFTYSSTGSAVTITGYVGLGGSVVIPSTINGLSVTNIGASAFEGKNTITSVSIPNTVTTFGNGAFRSCTSLTSVIIGSGVTNMGSQAFRLCAALTSVTISNGVTTIGQSAFNSCTHLTSITIPNSVTYINTDAFNGCSQLTTVNIGSGLGGMVTHVFFSCPALTEFNVDAANTVYASVDGILYNKAVTTEVLCPQGKTGSAIIPNSVTSIGDEGFRYCGRLTSITFGSGLATIGQYAFLQCDALNAINVDTANTVYASVDGILYNKATTTLMLCPFGKAGSLVIPSGVTSIGDSAFTTTQGTGAFQGCTGLTSVTIPDTVTSIAASAFQGCTGLTSVTIPDSVTTLGTSAFRQCTALNSVVIGSGVTTISGNMFYQCTALTSVTIPDTVTSIAASAFTYSGLTSVTIGNGVTSIGNNAFQNCAALESVIISDKVATIGSGAFATCTALTSVFVGKSVTTITSAMFSGDTALDAINVDADNGAYASVDGVVYNKGLTTLVFCPQGKTGSVTIPDSLASIPASAFSSRTKLTSVFVGSGVTSIGNTAFDGCTALTSMVFSGNAPTVGTNAFRNCNSLVVYYYEGAASSFTDPWQGRPCYMISVPVASFAADVASGEAPLTVQFTDQSASNGPASWSWNFGDGGTSTEKNPAHTYTTLGTYTVSLTVTNLLGSDDEVKTDLITVLPPVPVAAFIATPLSGMASLTVQFTDQSTNSPTSWSWNFGDGATSTEKNPTHTYVTPGTYTVSLTSTNAYGGNTLTKTDYITVNTPPAPVAAFSILPEDGFCYSGDPVQFRDESTGGIPTSWYWEFGDGATSTEQNPSHTYTAEGVYTVSLTATNAGGSSTRTEADKIQVVDPTPQAKFAFLVEGQHVTFRDQSSNTPTSWTWDFGDGTVVTYDQAQMEEMGGFVYHDYAAPGPHHVTLTVTNAWGTSTYGADITT